MLRKWFYPISTQEAFNFQISPVVILLLFCGTAFFGKLGGTGLMSYDDAYYAEKAREILVFKDFWTIHYNYQPSFDTAPLYYWLAALMYLVFGVTEYAACLPSALLATFTMVGVYFWVRREVNWQMGFIAGLVFVTIPHVLKFARHSMLDITLTFFTVFSLWAFYSACRGARKQFLLWGLCAGLGILTKSILGTFPIWIALSFLVLTWRWRILKDIYFWLGLCLALVVGLSWYVSHYILNHEAFVNGHIRSLLVERALLPEQRPDLMYRLKYLLMPIQYIPHWGLFMYAGFMLALGFVWRQMKAGAFGPLGRDGVRGGQPLANSQTRGGQLQTSSQAEWLLLILLWAVVITVILSMAANTKTWYLMAALPAYAILAAWAIHWLIQNYSRQIDQLYGKIVRTVFYIAVGFNLLVMTTPMSLSMQREVDAREFSPYIQQMGRSGFKMIAYKCDDFGLNNATLFYSDYAFKPIYDQAEEFLAAMRVPTPMAAMVQKSAWSELQAADLKVLKQGNNYLLVANRAVDFSQIQHLKARWMQ